MFLHVTPLSPFLSFFSKSAKLSFEIQIWLFQNVGSLLSAMKVYSALSGGVGGFWLLSLAKLGITLVVGEGMWLWWVVPLPKGVLLQFISLLSMAVSECGRDGVFLD